MGTTTKKDLIDRITEETELRRSDVKQVVQSFLDSVIEELSRGNRLEFRDFGVFEVRDRKPRMAQNPKTLDRIPVPARVTVRFKTGRRMRQAVEDGLGMGPGRTVEASAIPVIPGSPATAPRVATVDPRERPAPTVETMPRDLTPRATARGPVG
jgi:integration host factor subunit beta